MKVKKLNIEDFQEKKVARTELKTIFGGNPNNGPGQELLLNDEDDVPMGPFPVGPGGTGVTAGGSKDQLP